MSSEFQVNTYTDSDQERPAVTALSNGNFVVTWNSRYQDGSGEGVYGQIFTQTGDKYGSEFQVNTYTDSDQERPAVTALSNGNFVVTWQSYLQDGSEHGVYGQIFTQTGAKSGSEFQVNTYTDRHQTDPAVTALSNGNFVVTWDSYLQDGSEHGVYGQIFTETGAKSGSEFQVNTYTDSYQYDPAVTALSNGNFVVTWGSSGQDGSQYGVYGQIFTQTGAKSGSEFQVNTYTNSSQGSPAVTALSNGNFVVTWGSDGQDGSGEGVYGQIFTETGDKSGSEFQVNTYTNYDQGSPAVTALSNGNFVVTWMSGIWNDSNGQDGSGYGVYGQIFTQTGAKSGSEFQVNTYTDSSQWAPAVTALSNGNFVVTWQSYGQDGSEYGVYGRILGQPIAEDFTITQEGSINFAPYISDDADSDSLLKVIFTKMASMDTITSNGVPVQQNTEYSSTSLRFNCPKLVLVDYIYKYKAVDQNNDKSEEKTITQNFDCQYDDIAVSLGNKTKPQVATLTNGNFVVTWLSEDNNAVYAKLLDSYARTIKDDFKINDTVGSNVDYPDIARLENGGFVAVWEEEDSNLDEHIYARIFKSNGDSPDESYHVNNYSPTSLDTSPNVATLSDNSFIITWQHSDDSGKFEIRGRLYGNLGQENGQDFLISEDSTLNCYEPHVASSVLNTFLVTWKKEQNAIDYDIYAKAYSNSGILSSNTFLVNEINEYKQGYPSVTSLSDGRFVVAWESEEIVDNNSKYNIHARTIDISDSFEFTLGNEFAVIDTDDNNRHPSITALGYDKFLVTWEGENTNCSNNECYTEVYAKSYEINNGEAVDIKSFNINSYPLNQQQYPRASSLIEKDIFLVAWQSYAQEGEGYGIWMQLLDNTLNPSPKSSNIETSCNLGNVCHIDITDYTYKIGGDTNLQIIFKDLPMMGGEITARNHDTRVSEAIVPNVLYDRDSISYSYNDDYCKTSYTDQIRYEVIDSEDKTSIYSVIDIAVNPTCRIDWSDFIKGNVIGLLFSSGTTFLSCRYAFDCYVAEEENNKEIINEDKEDTILCADSLDCSEFYFRPNNNNQHKNLLAPAIKNSKEELSDINNLVEYNSHPIVKANNAGYDHPVLQSGNSYWPGTKDFYFGVILGSLIGVGSTYLLCSTYDCSVKEVEIIEDYCLNITEICINKAGEERSEEMYMSISNIQDDASTCGRYEFDIRQNCQNVTTEMNCSKASDVSLLLYEVDDYSNDWSRSDIKCELTAGSSKIVELQSTVGGGEKDSEYSIKYDITLGRCEVKEEAECCVSEYLPINDLNYIDGLC